MTNQYNPYGDRSDVGGRDGDRAGAAPLDAGRLRTWLEPDFEIARGMCERLVQDLARAGADRGVLDDQDSTDARTLLAVVRAMIGGADAANRTVPVHAATAPVGPSPPSRAGPSNVAHRTIDSGIPARTHPPDDARSFASGPAPAAQRESAATVAAARGIGLDVLARWVEQSPDAAELCAGVQQVSDIIRGTAALKLAMADRWTPTLPIDVVMATSRLLFEGVYGQWRSGWRQPPLSWTKELRPAAMELLRALERTFRELDGRVVLPAITDYSPSEHEGVGPLTTGSRVMPLSLRVDSGPPDRRQQNPRVRLYDPNLLRED